MHTRSSKDTDAVYDIKSGKKTKDTVCSDFWGYLTQLDIVDGDCPAEYMAFIQRVTSGLQWYWKWTDKPEIRTIDMLTEILKTRGRKSGHNSYGRILNIKRLKSLYQCAIRKMDNVGTKTPTEWKEGLEYATKKLKNLRGERARTIVNLICQKAIQHKVKAVFIENTCLDIHQKMPKAMLHKIDIWTPRHILMLCEQQVHPLGISVIVRPSKLSSHKDFFSHNTKPRLEKLSAEMIRKEVAYYSKIKKIFGETMRLYIDGMKDFLASEGTSMDSFDLPARTKPYLCPMKGGKFFDSDLLGLIDADENAAMYFLVEGLKSLLTMTKKPRAAKR